MLPAAILVSNVLRGRAFAGIGDYSGGKGVGGAVGVRKIEGLGLSQYHCNSNSRHLIGS